MAVIQNDLCAGGDIAGRDINNVYHNYQPITWYQRKFQSLAAEIENDHRYDKTIGDLEYFETVLDGRKGLQNKLKDGGHSELDISTALRQKQKFAKKQEKYKYYESAQWINSHLFADILMRFNDSIIVMMMTNTVLQYKEIALLKKSLK